MVSSSFQTENLAVCQMDVLQPQAARYVLLDVLGQTRHQVVAVRVQGLALGLVLVDRVDDCALERLRGVAGGVLRRVS